MLLRWAALTFQKQVRGQRARRACRQLQEEKRRRLREEEEAELRRRKQEEEEQERCVCSDCTKSDLKMRTCISRNALCNAAAAALFTQKFT